jgi:hypothetical protein
MNQSILSRSLRSAAAVSAFGLFLNLPLSKPSGATILERKTINNYSAIAGILSGYKKKYKDPVTEKRDFLVASDWDDVVDHDGKVDEETLRTIHHLMDENYNYLVITSRGSGRYIPNFQIEDDGTTFDDDYRNHAEYINSLISSHHEKTPLAKAGFLHLYKELKFLKSDTTYRFNGNTYQITWVAYDGVFFGGVPNGKKAEKGNSLGKLLDSDLVQHKAKVIVFVDDLKENIESVREAFKDRPEKVILLLFDPKATPAAPEKKPFVPSFSNLYNPQLTASHWIFNLIHSASTGAPSVLHTPDRTPEAVDHAVDMPPLENVMSEAWIEEEGAKKLHKDSSRTRPGHH